MKQLGNEIEKMLLESAKHIAKMVSSSSFELWKRKDFRLYVEFDKIPQTEQDRMFNELEVSLLGLFILQFDYTISEAEEEKKIVLLALQRQLSPAFISILADLGIENKFLKQWQQLIDIRLKEYREHVKLAYEETKKGEELKEDPDIQASWAQIETITIDCLSHIRRGDVQKDDPLWKLLRKWFITQFSIIQPIAKLSAENDEQKN